MTASGHEQPSPVWPLVAELTAWLAFAAAMWLYSYEFDRTIETYAFGTMGWARTVILLIALFAIASFVSEYQRRRSGAHVVAQAGRSNDRQTELGAGGMAQLIAAFALPFVYLWLLPRAGFFATTPFFLAGYMYVFGIRRKRHLIGTTFGLYAAVLLVFSKFLYVPLPTGNWPGFYDFSNVVLVLLAG